MRRKRRDRPRERMPSGKRKRVPNDCTVAEMPVGTSGYLLDVVLAASGEPVALANAEVLPRPDYGNAVPYHYIERAAAASYLLTVFEDPRVRLSTREDLQPDEVVQFASVFQARNLLDPRRERVPLARALGEDETTPEEDSTIPGERPQIVPARPLPFEGADDDSGTNADIGRRARLKARFGHPRRVADECTVPDMPIGTGGYLWQLAVDEDGRVCTLKTARVQPVAAWPYPTPSYYVQRTSETDYELTIARRQSLETVEDVPPEELVCFAAVFECPNLSHPQYRRLRLKARLWGDEGAGN